MQGVLEDPIVHAPGLFFCTAAQAVTSFPLNQICKVALQPGLPSEPIDGNVSPALYPDHCIM